MIESYTNLQNTLSHEWHLKPMTHITWSHGVVRATRQVNGRRQTYPSHHTHTLNRQSPNIAHVITSTISPHKPHLVKIAPVVTSPHIAKFTTHFFFIYFFLCTQNLSTDLSPCRIWCILALKYDIWWQQYYFNDLREYQLTKFWWTIHKHTFVLIWSIWCRSCGFYVVHTAWRIWIMDRSHS